MRTAGFTIVGLVILVLIGVWLSDPLARFGMRISYISLTNPMWMNGFFGAVDAPETSTPEDVVRAYFGAFLGAKRTADILEVERIHIWGAALGHQGYWSALVRTASGRDILYFQYRKGTDPLKPGTSGYWYIREYSAN